jgi:4-amino-4-deoxy-L-arabinose transferase-like glycosyltransferase
MDMKGSKNLPRLARIADAVPLALIAGLGGFSLVAIVLVLVGQFRTELIWTLGLATAVLFGWAVTRFGQVERPGSVKERLVCDIVMLACVLGWGGYNIIFTSQHILTNRDPATYAIASAWLSDRNDLRMEVNPMLSDVKGIYPGSAGFAYDKEKGTIAAQGQHILPALLGSIGKFVGQKNVLHFNILFGMTALLALYCFGRLFMRPYWAFAGVGVVAFSLPLLYFARDTYTEPLAATFTFGGLALLWLAQKNRHLSLWLIAGVVIGAGVLTRIDGYLTIVGVAAFLAVYTALARKRDEQIRRIKEAGAAAFAIAVMSVLAWLDLKLLSEHYYNDTVHLISQEVAAIAGVVVLGVIMNLVAMKKASVRVWLDKATANWRPIAAGLFILVVGLILVSRPIWYQQFQSHQNMLVAGLQQAEYSKVEPRTYSEITTYWVSWYIGPIMAGFGLVGLAYAAYRGMADKTMALLCALFVILGTSLVYFIKPSITPDQIWASRRMLPVIMPGIAIFGAYALSLLADKIRFPSTFVRRSVIGLAIAGLMIAPLTVSRFFLHIRDTTQYAFVAGLCPKLPKDAAVVWVGLGRLQAVEPTKTFCHVDSYGYSLKKVDKPTTEKLAEIAKTIRSKGKEPYLGVYSTQYVDLVEPSEFDDLTKVSSASFLQISQSLTAPPKHVHGFNTSASIAIIKNDGSLQKIKD